MSADCCTFECDQGRNCPARKAPASTHWCAKSRQPCATPYTCSTACRLVQDNSDGSSTHARPASRIKHLAQWLALTAALTAMAAMVAGFFG